MEYTKEELQQHLGNLAMRLAKTQELCNKQQEIIKNLGSCTNSVVYVLKEDYDDNNVNLYLIKWNTGTQKHIVVNGSDGDVC